MSRLSLQRAGQGSEILDFVDEQICSHDPEDTIAQTLVRLMHYCNHTSRDFDQQLQLARKWASVELQERDGTRPTSSI